MNFRNILKIAVLGLLALAPQQVLAQDKPIILITSDSKNAPVAGRNHQSIGYWDVDDYAGNGGGSSWKSWIPLISFDGSNHLRAAGTCSTYGDYMATLAINQQTIGQIKNLRLLVDDKFTAMSGFVRNQYGDCKILEARDRSEYLVGFWDIDGGGGQGSDGSSGTHFVALYADYGNGSSDRQLLDLQLIASDNKTPTSKTGYQIVGYWDVDAGGSRGTDGSHGKYMMTLLARWSR